MWYESPNGCELHLKKPQNGDSNANPCPKDQFERQGPRGIGERPRNSEAGELEETECPDHAEGGQGSEAPPIDLMAKTKSRKQVGLLLSRGSPLSKKQKGKLKRELHSGKVKVRR